MTSYEPDTVPSAGPSGPLAGLRTRPSQVWGAVRLVPLVRPEPVQDLRLHPRIHDGPGVVDLGRREGTYFSYIPHSFVAEWTNDGSPPPRTAPS